MGTDKNTVAAYGSHAKEYADRAESGKNTAHEYLEKPAMLAHLSDIRGKRVLVLGAGTGAECREYAKLGPASLVCTDITPELIEEGKSRYPELDLRVMDMEEITFPDASYDLVVSSLALHYLPNWKRVLGEVKRVLVAGGEFLFSVHHPMLWAAETVKESGARKRIVGFAKKGEDEAEVYGDYLTERPVADMLFNTLPVTYYHRPMSALVRDVVESGLHIKELAEPRPSSKAREKHPAFWQIHSKIPLFLIVKLRK